MTLNEVAGQHQEQKEVGEGSEAAGASKKKADQGKQFGAEECIANKLLV